MSFKITAESDLWESRGRFTLANVALRGDNLRTASHIGGKKITQFFVVNKKVAHSAQDSHL
jgi:hypothetical protein